MNIEAQEWKFKEVLTLLMLHSQLYIVKFFALVALGVLSFMILAADYHGLLVSLFTFVTSLLFDQMAKNRLDASFDFKKIGNLCNTGIVYISLIFIVVVVSLVAADQLKQNVPFFACKCAALVLSLFASFSALLEGVANLPPQVLPSQQEKSND